MKVPLRGLLGAVRVPAAGDAAALVERTLRDVGIALPGRRGANAPPDESGSRLAPAAGTFTACRIGDAAGGRVYKLYVPSRYRGAPAPLIVMLHGCTQSPDDFAAGTRMNFAAEDRGCLVAYPEQIAAANSSRCWNWFNRSEQVRGQGEPALIAGVVADIARNHAVDARRVYVAGLSAGGAAAAIMGITYPDVFAAIGVHSGLACGAAHDMASAFSAMRDGGTTPPAAATAIPAIVFHGDRDSTVNPRNADGVVAQLMPPGPLIRTVAQGQVPGGRAWQQTILTDPTGRRVLEQWAVRGLGHAWSGGSGAGSYTDPTGPDASREMLRFFLACPKPD